MMKKTSANDANAPSPNSFEMLYLDLLKRYYDEGNRERASGIASRLEEYLASPEYAHSIRGEEVRSIIAELRDDLPTAIQSREAEIRKILELHERALNTQSWDYVSRLYDHSDVSDRLDLLAILYDKQGDLDRAVAVLLESREYCQSRGIPFDAQDLLDELEHARRTEPGAGPSREVPRELLDNAIRRVYERFGTPADDIVVTERTSRQFTAKVNQLLPDDAQASAQDVKRRLLTMRRRGSTRGGLPRLERRSG